MTPIGLHALRKAVATVHQVRDVRLRITHGGRCLAEVSREAVVRTDGLPMRLTPCQMRAALAQVIGDAIAGRPITAFGLPLDVDPAIHLGVCPVDGSTVHAFGLVSRPDGDRHRVWFATTLSIGSTRACLSDLDGIDTIDVDLRRDDMLGVSVVELSAASPEAPIVLDVATAGLAACSAEELLHAVRAYDPTVG